MPEQISVTDFIRETWDDYNSPTTSNFVSRMGQCRNTVSAFEESLDYDRSGLMKMKKSVKALHSSGKMHVSNETYMAENLEKIGANCLTREQEPDIGAAFLKFAVVTKELSALMKNLMQNLNNILMFPLDSFLKGDLRGVKGDLKKPFDKAWKEYDAKFNKLEKEKKQIAREAGMFRTEVTGAEIAEEMEKERRMFQLQTCEYLIKVNEIKTKKGVELLQHLVEYYQAQNNFFQDGLKTIEHFRAYIEELVLQLSQIKQAQDLERRKLLEVRDSLKSTMSVDKETSTPSSVYTLHQLQGNKAHGCEKEGCLLKKSEGKVRKVWQKRKCWIKDGFLNISHSDKYRRKRHNILVMAKEPVILNLLTCQVKLVPDDPGRKCFDLISSSKSRTYHFQADDQQDMEMWISVLNNAKEAVLLKAFGESAGSESSPINQSLKELTRTIIQEVKRLPGNKMCCDCSAPDPEWLSVNLGVLICLECCGVHRDMGVHISRTQSIVIDDLGTSQLLLARAMSNRGFNDVMEATLDVKYKPTPSSNMDDRKSFIRAKYQQRRFAIVTCTNSDERKQDLKQAVLSRDLFALLQVYAEGVELVDALPDTDNNETALHLAILQENGATMHMVDFIIQNSNSHHLLRTTREGNSALHLCAMHNRTECMKLLLRVQPDLVNYENIEGQTALDIARDSGHEVCLDLINHALSGKAELFENVNVDWDLIQPHLTPSSELLDEHFFDAVDYSDDDLDGMSTPDRKVRSRPGSLVLSADSTLPLPLTRERSQTIEIIKMSNLLPPPPPAPPGGHKQNKAPSAGVINNSSMGTNTLTKKKAPAPPPPTYAQGHSRKSSDPGLFVPKGHVRTPSDPPPLPPKHGTYPKPHLAGAKFVLPPPPEFSIKQGTKPTPAPRNCRSTNQQDVTHSSSDSLNGRSASRADSTDSSGSDRAQPLPKPRLQPTNTGFFQAATQPHSELGQNQRKAAKLRRCRALYDCEADNDDELSFLEGEVIIVLKEEEEEWWEGHIEGKPSRRGMFPATFVDILPD